MRQFTILLLILAFIPAFSVAQTEDYQKEDREKVFVHITGVWTDILEAHAGFKPSNDIEGSPYLFDDWKKGMLYLTENRVVKDLTFNYNSCRNFLVYLKDGNQYSITKTDIINSVRYGDKKLVQVKLPDSDEHSKVFMEELVKDDNYSLYKRFFCKLNTPEHNQALNVGSKKFEYDKFDIFYVKKSDGIVEKLPKSKWRLYRFFDDKKDEIKDFVKSNDLDPDNEKDIIRIIEHYNKIK